MKRDGAKWSTPDIASPDNESAERRQSGKNIIDDKCFELS